MVAVFLFAEVTKRREQSDHRGIGPADGAFVWTDAPESIVGAVAVVERMVRVG